MTSPYQRTRRLIAKQDALSYEGTDEAVRIGEELNEIESKISNVRAEISKIDSIIRMRVSDLKLEKAKLQTDLSSLQHDKMAKRTSVEMILSNFYTTSEVSKVLGMPSGPIVRYAIKGKLPALRVGERWYFPKRKVDILAAEREELL
tara:strand:- start:2258 stop:2698 length:441 start_codon:yes stop_codon:yes gene_type:complete